MKCEEFSRNSKFEKGFKEEGLSCLSSDVLIVPWKCYRK